MSERESVRSTLVEPSPNGQGPAPDRSHRRLRALAVASTVATFLLIAVGALVRATGSGDACPDWPRCHGRWIPPVEYHNLIEYSHRLSAFVVIVLVTALAVVARIRYRAVPRVVGPTTLALGLVLFQALLGAVVVWSGLEALNVTAHLATALLLVGSLVVATVAAFSVDAGSSGGPGPLVVPARVAAAATFALSIVGALVRAEGAGRVFDDWPLMDGSVVPDVSSAASAVHVAHRIAAAAVTALVVWFAVRAWRHRRRYRVAAALAQAAAWLFLIQVMAGAANVWTGLAAPAVVAHVALASLAWGALVAAAASASIQQVAGPSSVRARAGSGVAT